MDDDETELIRLAVRGGSAAQRKLIELVTPAIQMSVGATLRRHTATMAQSRVRHEVQDLTQEVLCALFANDGRRLLAWDPEKGLSLPRYVGLLSRHLVVSFLRKRERRVWEDERVEDPDRAADTGESPEGLVGHRELCAAVLAAVEADLTRQGREIFHLLLTERLSVAEVCERTGLAPSTVHGWRSRIAHRAALGWSRLSCA